MSYLGNLNPYMTPADYAEELRRRQAMLRGQTPQAEQMSPNKPPQMSMPPTNAYGLTPEQMAAMSNDTSAEEPKIKNQMDYANALHGTKSAGPRQLGNVVVNNPWEGLEVGFNRALGGYLAGKSDKKLDALDAQKDKKAQALAALEESKYALDKDVKLRTLGVAEDGNRRAEEDRDRLVAGDEDTYQDAEGNLYTGFWQEDPRIGEKQFISGGEPLDITGMRPYDMYANRSGGRGGSTNAPERYVDMDGTPYYLSWDKANGVYRYAGGNRQGEVVSPELFEGLERRQELTSNQLERAIQGYNDDITPLRDLSTDIERAEQAIAELELEEGETVFNYLTKMRGVVGDLSRAPDPKLQNAHAAIQTVLNTITRQRAGLSQTLAEMDNVKGETGTRSIFTDPVVFSQYWDRLKDKVEDDMSFIRQNLSTEARRELDRRLGRDDDPDKPTPSNPRPEPEESGVAEVSRGTYDQKRRQRRQGIYRRSTTESSEEPQINDPMGFGVDKSQYTSQQQEEYLAWLREQRQ